MELVTWMKKNSPNSDGAFVCFFVVVCFCNSTLSALMCEHGARFISPKWYFFSNLFNLFLTDELEFIKTIIPIVLIGHESIAHSGSAIISSPNYVLIPP